MVIILSIQSVDASYSNINKWTHITGVLRELKLFKSKAHFIEM